MINPEQYEACDIMTDRDASVFLPKAFQLMDWSKETKVLDYGCGPGRRAFTYILPQVEKFQGSMYSVDIAQGMIDYAEKTYPHPSVYYARGDIVSEFPWKDVKFDNILSFYVLHFIDDIQTAFKGFRGIMKDGGHFGFMTLTAKSISTKALRLIATMDTWKEYMKGYEKFMVTWSEYPEDKPEKTDHFKSLLAGCGFTVKHCEVLQRDYKYDNIDLFLEICLVVNPFLHNVPKHLLPQLKEDYRKVVTEMAGVPLDTLKITVTHEHVFAVVQKPKESESRKHARMA